MSADVAPLSPPHPAVPAVPRLRPALDPLISRLLSRADLLHHWLDTWGSPLNIVVPSLFEANVERLGAVLAGAPVTSRIFYAHKANHARAFVEAARQCGIGVDVASIGELANARAAGLTPERIEATGPKGRSFLSAALDAGAVVNVDSLAELALLADLAASRSAPAQPVPVLVRLGGFGSSPRPGAERVSRFGVPPGHRRDALSLLAGRRSDVRLLGVSFHLDSADHRDRAGAVDGCLGWLEAAWAAGLGPTVLDLGGGLRQVFLADPDDFTAYTGALRRGLTGQGPPLTWNGHTFGYRLEGGAVRGVPVVHKYANPESPERTLEQLLALPLPAQGGRALADVASDNLLELWIEPGKALVDQAGLTLCRVELVTEAADGSRLTVLDLSRDKVCPADQEVFVDPILVRRPGSGPSSDEPAAGPAAVFLAGNLCLERDMIANRLIAFERLPEPGDIIAFTNTAAYQMDLSASDALLQPRARRMRLDLDRTAGFNLRPDGA